MSYTPGVISGARPARADIDLRALRANHAELRRRARGRELIAVVKADAYGHGAPAVARALLADGCRHLAVLSVAEAEPLRRAHPDVSILVLAGVHDPDAAEAALALRLAPVVHHRGQLERVSAAARARGARCPVHVEVDTGMRRMGFPAEEAAQVLVEVAEDPHLALAGTFTHFACADAPDPAESLEQLERFRAVLDAARKRGAEPGLVHVANSAALLAPELVGALPEARAVRPGLALYGVRPAPHLEADLAPVMTLVTRVVQLHALRAGESVGYGAEFRAPRDTRVATLALGYADGLPVSAGGRGQVLLRGRRFPIVGRVSMDYAAVEVGDAPVVLGDEAVVFGEGVAGRLPVEEAAAAAGTIPYELLVRVGARVPRCIRT